MEQRRVLRDQKMVRVAPTRRSPFPYYVVEDLHPGACFHCCGPASVYALIEQDRRLLQVFPTCDADRNRLQKILTASGRRFAWVEEPDNDYQAGASGQPPRGETALVSGNSPEAPPP
jgi:hypothetical protein